MLQSKIASLLQTAYLTSIELERYLKESLNGWQLIGECLPALYGMLKSDYAQMMKCLSIPVYFVQGFYSAFSTDVESFVIAHIPTEDELIEGELDSMSDAAVKVLTVFLMALVEIVKSAVKLLEVTPSNAKEWKNACKVAGIRNWSRLKIAECQAALIESGYIWN